MAEPKPGLTLGVSGAPRDWVADEEYEIKRKFREEVARIEAKAQAEGRPVNPEELPQLEDFRARHAKMATVRGGKEAISRIKELEAEIKALKAVQKPKEVKKSNKKK